MARERRIELYAQQYEFVNTPARRAAFVGGIGSGKSLSGCVRALMMSDISGGLGAVIAPTYPMLRDATLRTFLDVAGPDIQHFNRSDLILTLRNGFEILFRTGDEPERLRGPNLRWLFVDEAALCNRDVWRIGLGRLRQFGQAGYAWLATTPKGKNWVWEEFIQTPTEDHVIVRSRTADNPYIDAEFLQGLQREYVGKFAEQELGGEFVSFEGLIYDEFQRERHMWQGRTPHFARTVAGVDWGYTNPAVIEVFGMDSDNRLFAVDEFYRRQVRLEDHVAAAVGMANQWGVELFVCDPSEPEHIQAMRGAGLNAIGANNAIQPGIQSVKARLAIRGDGKPRFFVTEAVPNLIAEMESYQWAEHRGERLDKPEKVGDHAMDALRYVSLSLEKQRESTQTSYIR